MPKKAVATFFIAAFIGAALFVFFTFPRTKEQIPTSNNQRPFPSAPDQGPNGVPVPESVPHPDAPKLPPGPKLTIMAWASSNEAKALTAEADAFETATGRRVSLTIVNDQATYRHDLKAALASATPPDVVLVNSRDFSGLDPARDLTLAVPNLDSAPRSIAAFTVEGEIKAAPAEYSVNVLYYNPSHFDQAGIGYPDRHWNWDILEAISRALASLKLKTDSGQSIYPLELPADFDFWNILCTQAGHSALDRDVWHLTETGSKPSQVRALDFIHEFFQDLNVTVPLPKNTADVGHFFAQQRASLLIAPSDLMATMPNFKYAITLLPSDITRASVARVNGWAIPSKSTEPDAARELATYLSSQPIHAGWYGIKKPTNDETPEAICYETLSQSLIPRIDPKTAQLAQFLDQQVSALARGSPQKTESIYECILTEYGNDSGASQVESSIPQAAGLKPALLAPPASQLRSF